MSIHNSVKEAYKQDVLTHFKEQKYYPDTAAGFLNWFYDEDRNTEFVIYRYKNWDEEHKQSILPRLNLLWMFPIFCIVAPFKWLITGTAGFNQHTKFGKWLAKMLDI